MRYFLYKNPFLRYFLLRLTTPNDENALVEVIQVTDLEWADEKFVLTMIEVFEPEHEWQSVSADTLYLRVDAWPKYYFPTFCPATPGQNYTYQWYDIEDAEEMLDLIKQCLSLAEKVAGVRVGSR